MPIILFITSEKMTEFTSVVKKTKKGVFYITIPDRISKKIGIKLFMACKMKAGKNCIKIFGFQKTVKIKIEIDKKTLKIAEKIMKIEGYGSLDETISNAIYEFIEKNKKDKIRVVYIYPEEFIKINCILIDEFEKRREKNEKKSS